MWLPPKLAIPRFVILILTIATNWFPVAAGSGPERPKKDRASPVAGKCPTSMEEYRKISRARDEAIYAPRGQVRIKQCESFLKENTDPDLPEVRQVRIALLEAYLERGNYPLARGMSLLEEQARDSQDPFRRASQVIALVDEYFLKRGLPLESAESLLGRATVDAAEARRRADEQPESKPAEEERSAAKWLEFNLLLISGRVKLAKGDFPGALSSLMQADKVGTAEAIPVVLLREPDGQVVRTLPTGHPTADWLYLALASV